jgi:hypothetical protein
MGKSISHSKFGTGNQAAFLHPDFRGYSRDKFSKAFPVLNLSARAHLGAVEGEWRLGHARKYLDQPSPSSVSDARASVATDRRSHLVQASAVLLTRISMEELG